MSSEFLSDDLDNDEYAALLRGLQWIEGFGVFFVECTPAQAQTLIRSLSAELADKKIQTLSLDAEIKDLRECISQLDQSETIEVLFLTGLEKSFVPYIKAGYGGEGNYYKEDSVPPVLGRLNLDREAFKQAFPFLAMVCILPKFGIKYFIRRAPDFFDWRSGLFCFTTEKQILEQVLKEKTSVDYDIYLQLSETERQTLLLELSELIDEPNYTLEDKALLYREIARILSSLKRNEEALANYDKAITIKPDYYQAWFNRGSVLNDLGQKEEALASYDKAITIKSDYYQAWLNRGGVLYALGQKEEALTSFDKAIAIKPDYYRAWLWHGYMLDKLGQKEEALASYDKAIAIKPDDSWTWLSRGNVLNELGQKEEALASYEKALAIKPDYYLAWRNRGHILRKQGKLIEAAESFATALTIKPDDLSTLGNDIELALVQQNFLRMQKRIATILPLLQSNEKYFVAIPFLQFLKWLSSPTDSPQTVITVIQEFESNTKIAPPDLSFEDMQPAIARLTPEQQQIAQTFIAFFQNKIDFETLQKQIVT